MNALTSEHRAAHTEPWEPRPFLSHGGQGVHRKRPHLLSNKGTQSARDAGAPGAARQVPRLSGSQGIHRQIPELGHMRGDTAHMAGIYAYFDALAARLRRVRVCCGDWRRILGPSVTFRHGMTAVFLDPPYPQDGTRADVYAHEQHVFADVRQWAIENGDNPLLRIALCGYSFEMPAGWECVRWKAAGGYGSQGNGRGRENASREVIWFSPNCLIRIEDMPLFRGLL